MTGMRIFLTLLSQLVRQSLTPRADLMLENLALRQQLAVLANKSGRPRLRARDRVFWVALRRLWPRWERPLVLVKPDTVVRWHRAGFRAFWRWKSRPRRAGRPRVPPELRELIRRMASDNPLWGAPRIHGELQMLGFDVSERTVARCMPRRPPYPAARQQWRHFLRNHKDVVAAMDFLTVPTITFRLVYVFFVIDHTRRIVLHVNATRHPTSAWICQQLREAFPFDEAPRFLIFDRDAKFGIDVLRLIDTLRIRPVRTAFRSPWQIAVAERWVGSVRRDMLDHVIVLNARHLRRLLREYLDYYNNDRCHLALAKDAPASRPAEHRPCQNASVQAQRRLGGLHYRYFWQQAA